MTYFDLDGVIRDLTGTVFPPMEFKDWATPIYGQDLISYFDERLHLLVEAPPTEYAPIIFKVKDLHIITSQPQQWQENTTKWITSWRPDAKIIFASKKLHLLKDKDMIVEDYPKFDNYSQVVLIDHLYNRCVERPLIRITHPDQLEEFLEERGMI